ncbi:MAG: hypothetical protein LBI69_00740 [Puniceicoccales bacterium]|nr:hypothetical protein [Puniceicoccales bacterium]
MVNLDSVSSGQRSDGDGGVNFAGAAVPTDANAVAHTSTQSPLAALKGGNSMAYVRSVLASDCKSADLENKCKRAAEILGAKDSVEVAEFLDELKLSGLNWEKIINFMDPAKMANALPLVKDAFIPYDIIRCIDTQKAADILNLMDPGHAKIFLIYGIVTCRYVHMLEIFMAMDPQKAAGVLLAIADGNSYEKDNANFLECLEYVHPRDMASILSHVVGPEKSGIRAAAKFLCKIKLYMPISNSPGAILSFMDQSLANKILEDMGSFFIDFHVNYRIGFFPRYDTNITKGEASEQWREHLEEIKNEKGLWEAATFINSHVAQGRVALEAIQMEDCSRAVKIVERMAMDPEKAVAVLDDYSTFEISLKSINYESLGAILNCMADPQIAMEILLLRENRKDSADALFHMLRLSVEHTMEIVKLIKHGILVEILNSSCMDSAADIVNLMDPADGEEILNKLEPQIGHHIRRNRKLQEEMKAHLQGDLQGETQQEKTSSLLQKLSVVLLSGLVIGGSMALLTWFILWMVEASIMWSLIIFIGLTFAIAGGIAVSQFVFY